MYLFIDVVVEQELDAPASNLDYTFLNVGLVEHPWYGNIYTTSNPSTVGSTVKGSKRYCHRRNISVLRGRREIFPCFKY